MKTITTAKDLQNAIDRAYITREIRIYDVPEPIFIKSEDGIILNDHNCICRFNPEEKTVTITPLGVIE